MGSRGGPGSLVEEPQACCPSHLCVRRIKKVSSHQPTQKRVPTKAHHAGALVSDFQPPRAMGHSQALNQLRGELSDANLKYALYERRND